MDPALLLIIVFIVAPLIERLLKAGKPQEPPQRTPRRPPRQQQQRVPPRADPDRERVVLRPRQQDEDDAAAAMLPDDLWEILTGEQRAPRLPEPRPEPDIVFDDEAESIEDATPDSWVEAQTSHTADSAPVLWERPEIERPAPRVVSLEKLHIDERARHDQFHKRLDELSEPARVRRAPRNAYSLNTDEDLRRAVILAEILGPPKGLE